MNPVLLSGGLAGHARGRTLSVSFGGTAAGDVRPQAGTMLVFGRDVQREHPLADTWLSWCDAPGRLVVAVPPFDPGTCERPAGWEARRSEPLAGGDSRLGRLLAGERQHELRGQLLPLERIAGQVVTACWRRHPAAGLFVVTTLPLWSLTTLDHREACLSWLDDLLEQAGKPILDSTSEAVVPTGQRRTLTQEEWTMLLHLCTGIYDSTDSALSALELSTLHRLDPEHARSALEALEGMGLILKGILTERGRITLLEGPYAAYARALWRQCGQDG